MLLGCPSSVELRLRAIYGAEPGTPGRGCRAGLPARTAPVLPPPAPGASEPGPRYRRQKEHVRDVIVCHQDGVYDVNHGKHRND